MKLQVLLSGVVALLIAGACTSTQPVASSEYDDVYFTSSDYTERARPVRQQSYADRDDYQDSRYYEDGYNVYDEDDFYYSRRLRRFNQPNYNAWRYYDPFFTNDLYYVMGTPYWNDWYGNRGWYSWTRPRFGASLSVGFGRPFTRFGTGFYDPFYSYNSFNYYNPWVSSYYGYDPFFGFGARSSFYNPYVGASYWYCPPTAYVSNVSYRAVNVSRRASLSSLRSQTGYAPIANTTRTQSAAVRTNSSSRTTATSPRTRTSTLRSSNYLRPKTEAEKRAALSDTERRRNAIRRANSSYRQPPVRTSDGLQRRSSVNGNTRTSPTSRNRVSPNRRNSTLNRNPSVNRRSVPTTRQRTSPPSYNRSRSTTPSRSRTSPTRRPPNSSSSFNRSSSRSSSPSMNRSSSSSRSSAPSSRSSSSRRPPQ